jgi:hypothetical protein
METTTREYLQSVALDRQIIDRFLDPDARNWAVFDSELGYLLKDSFLQDGVDGSYTISSYAPTGERRVVNFADQPCRINTYGNSFTQCHQVSDGETWQEYLAAHLGEPIRNFGIGGYGVYQAYRRLLRVEKTAAGAENIIFNIWSDDHFRSVYKWRMLHIPDFRQNYVDLTRERTCMFHANPWPHLRLHPDTGQFQECENPYATPEALYLLCDPDHVYDAFKDDFEVQAFLAQQSVSDVNLGILDQVAQVLGCPTDFRSPEATANTARDTLQVYALRASMYVCDRLKRLIEDQNKKLMIFLSYSSRDVRDACQGLPRSDALFVSYLKQSSFNYVDVLQKHIDDFQSFSISPDAYVQRYFKGHYGPRGNHFFAFAIKDAIVDWLVPKPPTYRECGPALGRLAAMLA